MSSVRPRDRAWRSTPGRGRVWRRAPGRGARAKGGPAKRGQRALRPGELAYALRAVCDLAFAARARGACLGEALPGSIRLGVAGAGRYVRSSPGSRAIEVTHVPPRPGRHTYAHVASAVAHARGGHDSGCHGLGVSLEGLGQLAAAWGAPGESEYVLDAFRAAAEHLIGETVWSAPEAAEVLEDVVRARITPELPERDAVLSLSQRGWAARRRGWLRG